MSYFKWVFSYFTSTAGYASRSSTFFYLGDSIFFRHFFYFLLRHSQCCFIFMFSPFTDFIRFYVFYVSSSGLNMVEFFFFIHDTVWSEVFGYCLVQCLSFTNCNFVIGKLILIDGSFCVNRWVLLHEIVVEIDASVKHGFNSVWLSGTYSSCLLLLAW